MKQTLQERVIERPLPSNVEAERTLLGAILLDNGALLEAVSVVNVADFYGDANRRIFRTMVELSERATPIEMIHIVDALQGSEELEDSGGAAYVASLSDGLTRVSNVVHYAKLIREKSLLRQTITIAHRVQELAFEGAAAESVLDHAAQSILDLAIESSTVDSDGKSYRDAAISLLKSFEEKSLRRVMSGIEELDSITGGFRDGELVTVTAGTGVGKTLFAQQVRRRACADNLHSMYASGEMSAEHLLSRELATEACVDHRLMRVPERLTKEEYQSLVQAATHECLKCKILDGELSLQRIRVAARRRKRSTGLDLLIADYDELIDAPGKNEIDQQRTLIRGLKAIGVELKIPVIVISQLRKSLDKEDAKKPSLEKIYGSGAKSKHSSYILYLDREYVRELTGDETKGRLCILKARDGRVGQMDVLFNIKTLRFEDAPKFGDEFFKEPSRAVKKKQEKEAAE